MRELAIAVWAVIIFAFVIVWKKQGNLSGMLSSALSANCSGLTNWMSLP
jgi:hypothetical protein